jgi:hypothetical protein
MEPEIRSISNVTGFSGKIGALPAAADMMMVVPIPAAMTDPMIERVARAHMDAHIADMYACTGTAGSRAGSRANRADLNAGANLGVCGTPDENRNCKQRSRQRFHIQIPQGGKMSFAVNNK